MKIQCHTGLAGRVVAIANGLHLFGSIQFGWAENRHCPCGWRDLFPDGIPGVEFVDHDPNLGMTRVDRIPIDMLMDGSDYATIIGRLPGTVKKYDTAIIARFFRHKDIDPVEFAKKAAKHAHGHVFVLADSFRHEIASELMRAECTPIMPASAELTYDMDRGRESVIAFARDWKTALAARKIITHEHPSGLTIPAKESIRIQA